MIAYAEGFRCGRADRLNGWLSRYSWASFGSEPAYVQEFSSGYRAGWGIPAKE